MIEKIKNIRRIAIMVPVLIVFGLLFIILTNSNERPSQIAAPNSISNINNQTEEIPKDDISSSETDTTSKPLDISITRATRSMISVYIEKIENGTCKLTVNQKNITVVSLESKTTTLQDYSTCEGFSIDNAKLSNSTFIVKVDVFSEGRKGTASKEVR